jgi:thiamine biosynthesis lipoprotein
MISASSVPATTGSSCAAAYIIETATSNIAVVDRALTTARGAGYFRVSFLAMGSPCELLVAVSGDAEATELGTIVADEAWRIEDKFSRYIAGNIVDRINSGERVEVDDETAGLLDFASTLFELSDGRFDISSGVLREAWHFDGSDRIPSPGQVEKILERVGWQKLSWDKPVIQLAPGMEIDFGGIGKEYAVDRAASLLSASTPAPALVNFGGDIMATAPPPDSDGWQVGIDSVDSEQRVAQKLIKLGNGGLATSGDARRYLMKDGVRYGHILDPTTGWPVPDAPRSVTVAADTCTQAGMLCTLAMLKGADAEAFLETEGARFWVAR